MGTRADFYVGRGEKAEWLGSIAFDGHPDGNPESILDCKTEEEYRNKVEELLQSLDHATFPKDGWPWPWKTSELTDFSYAFDNGLVYACCFGYQWWVATNDMPKLEGNIKHCIFPDMSAVKNVTLGRRSGLIFIPSH